MFRVSGLTSAWRVGIRFLISTGPLQGRVQLVAVNAGIIEGIAAAPMRQRQFGGHPDVLLLDGVRAAPRGVRGGGPSHHQIGPHAVHVERRAQRRDAPYFVVWQHHIVNKCPCLFYPAGQLGVGVGVALRKLVRVRLVGHPPPDDLHAHVDVTRRVYVDGETEPVQQLWTQFALFWIHCADQDEPGLV
jgi:hypothetical protein